MFDYDRAESEKEKRKKRERERWGGNIDIIKRRDRERKEELIKNGLVWFICLTAYQLLKGYLMPQFDSFVNIW